MKIKSMHVNWWVCGSCGKKTKRLRTIVIFVGNLKYFLSLEKLFTCLSQVNTVAALSETGS